VAARKKSVVDTEVTIPAVQLPDLRMFRVVRQNPRYTGATSQAITEEIMVVAHSVTPQDKVLFFVEISLIGDVPVQRITRAFYGWIEYQELSMPSGAGSVQ
jgi:hypothetical protein